MPDTRQQEADTWTDVKSGKPAPCLLLETQDAANNLDIGWFQDGMFSFVTCRTAPRSPVVRWRYWRNSVVWLEV